MYKEEDFLQLSGIQHFAFCRRQWALAYIELQWQENVRTVEGKIFHENAHDVSMKEKRGDLLIVRAMPIHSWEMGVSGECDVVEFHKVKDGIQLAGKEGLYKAVPVEYKRGRPKTDDSDILQVAAQAMCLEEMLCCDICCRLDILCWQECADLRWKQWALIRMLDFFIQTDQDVCELKYDRRLHGCRAGGSASS